MKSMTQVKSLKDVRTTISTHSRSTPRLKGTTYLEAYLLDKERQRLETELDILAKRQGRIQERLDEIGKALNKLVNKGPSESPIGSYIPAAISHEDPGHNWGDSDPLKPKTMPVEY